MPKITLLSVAFHGYEFTCGPKRGEGAPLVIAEFSAPWTEKNRKAGAWQELPETVSGTVRLVPSSLAASHFEFVPGKGLEKYGVSMDCTEASDFQCFVPIKEGESRELRFRIKSAVEKAGRVLDTLGRTIGGAAGKLTISYPESHVDGDQAVLIATEEMRAAQESD